ncbi:MAG: CAP domain-containing protein [Actinomycetota bacterium]
MRVFRGALVPRVLPAAVLGVVAILVLSLVPSTPRSLTDAEPVAKYSFKKSERCFLRKINNMRHRNGKKRLERDKQLGYVARRHARSMASNGSIYHDGDLGSTVTRWKRLGQNVGRGGRCRGLFKAFKKSSGHRANILGSWRHMGVGTKKRNGNLFAMHVFQSRRNPGNVYHYP